MKIFVINLARDRQRRENASRQLDAQNVTFEFFPAIEVSDSWQGHFASYDEQAFLINTGRRVTRGEIGCYASHKALWQKCIDLGEPIMIMEDDFLLDERFSRAVHITGDNISRFHFIRLQSETRARKQPIEIMGEFTLFRYSKIPHSLMCYAVTPRVCTTFLQHSHALVEPVDVMIKKAWVHRQPIYGLAPYTVTESELSSDSCIGERRKDKKSLNIKWLRLITKINWVFQLWQYNRAINKNMAK